MIKVLVYWESGMGTPKTYTLKEFQELFNQATYNNVLKGKSLYDLHSTTISYDVFDKINGNKIEFIVE